MLILFSFDHSIIFGKTRNKTKQNNVCSMQSFSVNCDCRKPTPLPIWHVTIQHCHLGFFDSDCHRQIQHDIPVGKTFTNGMCQQKVHIGIDRWNISAKCLTV